MLAEVSSATQTPDCLIDADRPHRTICLAMVGQYVLMPPETRKHGLWSLASWTGLICISAESSNDMPGCAPPDAQKSSAEP